MNNLRSLDNKHFKISYGQFCRRKWDDPSYYKEITLDMINKPFTILLGPNGSGKSTSLRTLMIDLENKNKMFRAYSNKLNDIVMHSEDLSVEDLIFAFRSEGERLTASFNKWGWREITSLLYQYPNENIYFLIDELDSGLSYDRLDIISENLWDIWITEKKNRPSRNIYFILTANSYEMVSNFNNESITDYIWIPTKTKLNWESDLETYDKFKELYEYYSDYMKKKIKEEEKENGKDSD